jgi:hypothetical protein
MTPQRFALGLACLILFEGVLSTVGLNNARRAKADLEMTIPGSEIHLTSAVWINADCGTFQVGGEPPGQVHRFLDRGGVVTTDISPPDPEDFEARWRSCKSFAHGRGDWQNPIFDAVILPRV